MTRVAVEWLGSTSAGAMRRTTTALPRVSPIMQPMNSVGYERYWSARKRRAWSDRISFRTIGTSVVPLALRRPGDTRACGRIVSTRAPKREVTCMQASNPTTSAVSAGRKPRDDEIDVFGLTHPGKVRDENQDHFLISSLHKQIQVHLTSLPTSELLSQHTERLAFLAMVADGVGGTAGGEEASRLAVGAITRYVTQAIHCYYSEDAMDEQRLPRALESAALRVHEDIQRNRPTGPLQAYMATTLTLWIGVWPRAYLLQVGDSRCYLLRNGELMQLSRDQTLAQDLVDRGVFRRSDTLSSPFSNVLSSALGGPEASPIVTHMQQEWGNVGLLCSDGLTKHVPDNRIRERLLAMKSAKQVCEDLLRDALDAGGTDNVTVLVGRTLRKDPS